MQKQRHCCGEMTASAAEQDSKFVTKRTEPNGNEREKKNFEKIPKITSRANLEILDRVMHESEG